MEINFVTDKKFNSEASNCRDTLFLLPRRSFNLSLSCIIDYKLLVMLIFSTKSIYDKRKLSIYRWTFRLDIHLIFQKY